jgi:hypothetical protein
MITGDHPVPPPEMPCYPGMSLKKQILVGFVWADSVTSLENQPVEMQALSGFEDSARVAQKKDVKKRRAKPECPLGSALVRGISYDVVDR